MEPNRPQPTEGMGTHEPHRNQEVEQVRAIEHGKASNADAMFESLAKYLENRVEVAVTTAGKEKSGNAFEQFMRYRPPSFSGTGALLEAEDWLRRIGDIFEIMNIEDDQQVRLAAFQLTDQATLWWKNAKNLLATPKIGRAEPNKISWVQFVSNFNDKYFPESYRNEMRREFMKLEQERGMSVQEYEVKFTTLSRFASKLIEDEYEKCRKFQEGLKPFIRNRLTALDIRSYTDLVHRAKLVECDLLTGANLQSANLQMS